MLTQKQGIFLACRRFPHARDSLRPNRFNAFGVLRYAAALRVIRPGLRLIHPLRKRLRKAGKSLPKRYPNAPKNSQRASRLQRLLRLVEYVATPKGLMAFPISVRPHIERYQRSGQKVHCKLQFAILASLIHQFSALCPVSA